MSKQLNAYHIYEDYIAGDKNEIIIDGTFNLDNLKEIVKELESNTEYYWEPTSGNGGA